MTESVKEILSSLQDVNTNATKNTKMKNTKRFLIIFAFWPSSFLKFLNGNETVITLAFSIPYIQNICQYLPNVLFKR